MMKCISSDAELLCCR